MAFDAEDIAVFNDTDLPGYALATISAAPVHGRFRASSADPFGIVAAAQASFTAATTDISSVAVGDSVAVGGTTYTVADVQLGGLGQTRLLLKT